MALSRRIDGRLSPVGDSKNEGISLSRDPLASLDGEWAYSLAFTLENHAAYFKISTSTPEATAAAALS